MLLFDCNQPACTDDKIVEKFISPIQAVTNQISATQNYCAGFNTYLNNFLMPFYVSTNYFRDVEIKKLSKSSPMENIQSYLDLMCYNYELSNRSLIASMKVVNEFFKKELPLATDALLNTFLDKDDGETLESFTARLARMTEVVTRTYPKIIDDIEPEYGFHFEQGINIKYAETDRFILYQVLPIDNKVKVREDGKPILIIPPYVLGANILGFLPGENRSYTHCFANLGIPTYIRIMKDISKTPALQTMTGEDDALDTRLFCEKIKARHGKPVTLNGYCQGGFMSVCNVLSGKLDGLVDALITCVAPMDGTRSKGLKHFLESLPERFRDLAYGTKTLSNGNKVGDGDLMGWVYKLKSIEVESPLVAFFRDMMMLSPKNGKSVKISKTAAALNYWLKNERNDLPLAITEMSFASYTIPVTDDGTLPVELFGQKLNFKRIQEKGIKWLICYGKGDDLVEADTALAPLDYIDAEVSAFPKGHVAIATSWSDPGSACALHTRFGPDNHRGPVRFQLDLEIEQSRKTEEDSQDKIENSPESSGENENG